MNDRNLPLPLSYRSELLRRMMPTLRSGECCSLVGVSGVGKSNLAQFLRRLDVQAAYWDTDYACVVPIDTHGLVFGEQPAEYVVAELMIHRLIMESESRGLPGDLVTWASDLHARLVAQPNTHLAQRYLERICARFCEGLGLQLIFVFDQFEDLWRELEARFFLNLRYLRDQFKYQVVYLLVTRERLQRSRHDLAAVEAFWELFSAHVYGLGMYGPDDALTMLERLAKRRCVAVNPDVQQAAIQASGKHPALLRAVFWALLDMPDARITDQQLLELGMIAEECKKIWNDLMPDEQHLARIIALGLPLHDPEDSALADLRLKGIVILDPPALFSQIFSAYVVRKSGADIAGVVVVPRLRQVLLDGQLLAKPLSPLEFGLLEYLARHKGTVCRREDILRELYKGQDYDPNDERLDTVLRRLREALGEDARDPHYLITHRGVGIQLVQGGIQD